MTLSIGFKHKNVSGFITVEETYTAQTLAESEDLNLSISCSLAQKGALEHGSIAHFERLDGLCSDWLPIGSELVKVRVPWFGDGFVDDGESVLHDDPSNYLSGYILVTAGDKESLAIALVEWADMQRGKISEIHRRLRVMSEDEFNDSDDEGHRTLVGDVLSCD